jgi:hypothetical protein
MDDICFDLGDISPAKITSHNLLNHPMEGEQSQAPGCCLPRGGNTIGNYDVLKNHSIFINGYGDRLVGSEKTESLFFLHQFLGFVLSFHDSKN